MASIIDLFRPRAPEAKAVTGPGVSSLMWSTPINSLSRHPNRLMAEAQALFHTNGWVNAAERAIVGRFQRMTWHLEDDNGDTVEDTSAEQLLAIQRLLERPQKGRTWRQTSSITLRHVGLCGNAFWVLDQTDALAGTPLQILYVNPARMEPVYAESGSVQGWLLDGPNNPVSGRLGFTGVPLTTEEVVHFTLDEPDWGAWGIGIAEAAQRKIELDRLTDSHSGGVLSSGGRLTGLIAPKEGVTVNDDQWKQFVSDYRRITEDPDAAKRLQIAKMPLDFTQMTASPKDLQLVDVAKGNRDDIMALWGVPPSQIGIMAARGLNSGETVKYEEAALWQGAIEPRAEAFREKVQTELLDRFAELGVKVTLVFDYPEFDDQAPLFENASKAKLIPLTNAERRALVGLDPLEDDELNNQVWMASEMVRVDEEPEPELPPVPAAMPQVEAVTNEEVDVVEGKASTRDSWEARIRRAVAKVLAEQKAYVLGKTDHAVRKNDVAWFDLKREDARLMAALEPLIAELVPQVATARKPAGKADLSLQGIVDFVRRRVGDRISGINKTTREKVQAAVQQAVTEGMSPRELGDLLEQSAAFDEYRAEMIARTETAYAYNETAIQTYRSLGTEKVEVIDGDRDDVCAPINGATWTMDEALANPIGHPNCTRDFIPVIS